MSLIYQELLSEVSAQTQQQQDVHSEQIEAEQQGGALAGAEGHSEHPHQAGATSADLHEKESTVGGNSLGSWVFIITDIKDDKCAGTGH